MSPPATAGPTTRRSAALSSVSRVWPGPMRTNAYCAVVSGTAASPAPSRYSSGAETMPTASETAPSGATIRTPAPVGTDSLLVVRSGRVPGVAGSASEYADPATRR